MQIDISPLKKRIIIFLFCLAIIALAANVIIDKIFNDSDLSSGSRFGRKLRQ